MRPDLLDVDVVSLWHCGYYDGPLSGVCLHEERICWFEVEGDPVGEPRRYLVYELTDDEVRHEVTNHFLFELYVGLHTCDHATLDGERRHGVLHPQARWSRFYDRHKPSLDRRTDKTPIGRVRSFRAVAGGDDPEAPEATDG